MSLGFSLVSLPVAVFCVWFDLGDIGSGVPVVRNCRLHAAAESESATAAACVTINCQAYNRFEVEWWMFEIGNV
jgi:hypothetical protein